jgi:hypothetical protein
MVAFVSIRWRIRIRVRREGAPNRSRGGCAPQNQLRNFFFVFFVFRG